MINEYLTLINDAEKLELTNVHDFGQINLATKKRTNTAPSPKKSSAGQWYLKCVRCGKAMFEGKTGSAVSSNCI